MKLIILKICTIFIVCKVSIASSTEFMGISYIHKLCSSKISLYTDLDLDKEATSIQVLLNDLGFYNVNYVSGTIGRSDLYDPNRVPLISCVIDPEQTVIELFSYTETDIYRNMPADNPKNYLNHLGAINRNFSINSGKFVLNDEFIYPVTEKEIKVHDEYQLVKYKQKYGLLANWAEREYKEYLRKKKIDKNKYNYQYTAVNFYSLAVNESKLNEQHIVIEGWLDITQGLVNIEDAFFLYASSSDMQNKIQSNAITVILNSKEVLKHIQKELNGKPIKIIGKYYKNNAKDSFYFGLIADAEKFQE